VHLSLTLIFNSISRDAMTGTPEVRLPGHSTTTSRHGRNRADITPWEGRRSEECRILSAPVLVVWIGIENGRRTT
jgi:hypothetical protein